MADLIPINVDREFLEAVQKGADALRDKTFDMEQLPTKYGRDVERISRARRQYEMLDEFVKSARYLFLRA